MRLSIRYIFFMTLALGMSSCFTGVESTPKITYADVKKEHIRTTPEMLFLSDIQPEKPALWQKGKSFYVTDSKIGLMLTMDNPSDTMPINNTLIFFDSIAPVNTVTGNESTMMTFRTQSGNVVRYKTDIPYKNMMERDSYDVPFTIEMNIVEQVRSRLVGNTYYITTPIWYNSQGTNTMNGLRHIAVIIDYVVTGNSEYPLRVVFHRPGVDESCSLFMTVGNKRTATRNFDTLFAFDNPRKKFDNISDDVWDLIIHSRIKIGMTKQECRLALGTPTVSGQRPTTAGMVEYWQYADGIYLVFEDGYLAMIR